MNEDYGRHILRTWVDTHKKSIRADPEIYLPGEVDARDADGESDDDHDTHCGQRIRKRPGDTAGGGALRPCQYKPNGVVR